MYSAQFTHSPRWIGVYFFLPLTKGIYGGGLFGIDKGGLWRFIWLYSLIQLTAILSQKCCENQLLEDGQSHYTAKKAFLQMSKTDSFLSKVNDFTRYVE